MDAQPTIINGLRDSNTGYVRQVLPYRSGRSCT